MKNVFLEYAEVKDEIKSLTEQAKELEKEVIEEMKDQKKVTFEFGMFIVSSRKSWKYTDETNEKIKEMKKEEEENGKAVAKETNTLIYKVK